MSTGAGEPKLRIWLDDVGRRERERDAGEALRQHFAQLLDVVGRRRVAFLERDLDVAVLLADDAGVVVGQVDARDREADVVDHRLDLLRRNDFAHDLLHGGELVRGFLDARADLRAHVHQDLAAVDRREEVAAEERHQRERAEHEGEEARDEHAAVRDRERQDLVVGVAKAQEAALEGALEVHQRIARARLLVVALLLACLCSR